MSWNIPKFHDDLENIAQNIAYKDSLGDKDLSDLAAGGHEPLYRPMHGEGGLQFLALRPIKSDQKNLRPKRRDSGEEKPAESSPDSGSFSDKPILAFRGSERTDLLEGYKDWVKADFLSPQVGESQFAPNRKLIETTLKVLGGEVIVIGHSLGGALAQITASEFPSAVSEVITFQSPGVSKEAAEKLKHYNSQSTNRKVSSTHYQEGNDFAHKAGEFLTEGDVVGIKTKNTSGLFGPHSADMLGDTSKISSITFTSTTDSEQSKATEFARKSPSIALEAAKTAIDPLAHPAESPGYLNKIIADWFRDSYNEEAKRRAILSSA